MYLQLQPEASHYMGFFCLWCVSHGQGHIVEKTGALVLLTCMLMNVHIFAFWRVCKRDRKRELQEVENVRMGGARVSLDSPLGAGRATLSWCWWPPWERCPSSCCVSFPYPGRRRPPCSVRPRCCPGRRLSHDEKQEETADIRHTVLFTSRIRRASAFKGNKIQFRRNSGGLCTHRRKGIETQQWQAENGWKTAPHKRIHF